MKRLSALKALMIVALAPAILLGQAQKPDFSGHWELDRSKSKIVSPDKLRAGSIQQVIEQRGAKIKVTRIIHSDDREQKLDLQLATDGSKQINKVEGRDLRFRTLWSGSRLVIVIETIEAEAALKIREVWSLSADGNTLTIELRLPGGKYGVREKLVYVRSGHGS